MREPDCRNCEIQNLCTYNKAAEQAYHLNLSYQIFKELSVFLSKLLPKHCKNYREPPLIEGERDALGRMIDRKPLKLWYPNQNIEEEVEEKCKCWYCAHGFDCSDNSQIGYYRMR